MQQAGISQLQMRPQLRGIVGRMLWLLLGGYLIWNRSFAKLGIGSLYIGELILSIGILSTLQYALPATLEPLRRSWTFRILGALWIYGALRAVLDFFDHGFWALRDAVVVGYGFVAFLCPIVWLYAETQGDELGEVFQKNNSKLKEVAADLPGRLLPGLLLISGFAFAWAWATRFAFIDPPPGMKPDFLAIATAVAIWVFACVILRDFSFRMPEKNNFFKRFIPAFALGFLAVLVTRIDLFFAFGVLTAPSFETRAWAFFGGAILWTAAFFIGLGSPFKATDSKSEKLMQTLAFIGLGFGVTAAFQLLTQFLPTRALWLAPPACLGLAFLGFAHTPKRKIVFGALCGLVLAAGVYKVTKRMNGMVAEVTKNYHLNDELGISLDEVEKKHRGEIIIIKKTGPVIMGAEENKLKKDRIEALLGKKEKNLQTLEGKFSGHALTWRALWWTGCAKYTLKNSPLLGIGFGNNPTYLFRENPHAWPQFIGSMAGPSPNRSPHSAHIVMLTRLGILGLALWLALIAAVIFGTLRTCWHCRRKYLAEGPEKIRLLHRKRFWAGVAILGIWITFLTGMSFGVVLENPMGGIWFWAMTGVLAWWNLSSRDQATPETV